MRYSKYVLFGVFFNVLWSACSQQKAELPAYIYVPKVSVASKPAQEGSGASKITDVWVYLDNIFMGAFPLPATFPLLATAGEHEIQLFAGIKENGIVSLPSPYPFYERAKSIVNLQPNQTDTLLPVVLYKASSKFAFIEDFEGTNQILRLDRDQNVNTKVETTNQNAFEGSKSGIIELDTANFIIEVATADAYANLQALGTTPVFVELNYWSDIDFQVGLVGIDDASIERPYYDLQLFGKKEWNKVYVNFRSALVASQFKSYRFALRAILPIDGNGKITQQKGKILLDNIKLVYF